MSDQLLNAVRTAVTGNGPRNERAQPAAAAVGDASNARWISCFDGPAITRYEAVAQLLLPLSDSTHHQ